MAVPHRKRAFWSKRPYHVTIRSNVPGINLTIPEIRSEILHALTTLGTRDFNNAEGIAILAYNILPNHLHLVVQYRPGTSGGFHLDALFGLAFRKFFAKIARAVNRVMRRKGAVFSERYFARVLKSATEIVNAVKYVLWNRSPKQERVEVHPCMSLHALKWKTVPLAALGYAREVLEKSFLRWILVGMSSA